MSKAEKEAIEYYKNNEYTFGFETDMDIETFKKALGIEETDEDTFEKHQIRFKTLLNLIEKLQKELEQEKEKNKELEIIKRGIEILKSNFVNDETYYVISKNDFINKDYKNLLNNYVSKDKIRAKIEELKNDEKNIREKKNNSHDYDRSSSRLQAYLTKTKEMIKRLEELLEE